MSSKVEEVAQAICERSGQTWVSAGSGYREICEDFARAAIEAMREPTNAMFDAAEPFGICMSALDDAYQAMIDAALREERR